MTIVIDKAIPFIQGIFEKYADVRYLEGQNITASDEEVEQAAHAAWRQRSRFNFQKTRKKCFTK